MPQHSNPGRSLKIAALWLTISTGVLGAIQAYTVLPYRVLQVEKKAETISAQRDLDHDLLIQVARDIQYVREHLNRISSSNNKP